MLDIAQLRQDINAVATKLSTRSYSLDVDTWTRLDGARKSLQAKVDHTREAKNKISQEIGKARMTFQPEDDLRNQSIALEDQIKSLEEELAVVEKELADFVLAIPNIPAESVPVGTDESFNVEVGRVGVPPIFNFEVKDHVNLGESLGLDFETSAKLAGSRFCTIKGGLARLHRALIQFMLNTHTSSHGYTEVYVPYLVNAEALRGTGQLPKFEQDLFKIDRGDASPLYLIPTAEVPVTNMVADMILKDTELPLKLVAHTPCFRSEAGSYGKDIKGLIRQHQFEKVELVQIVHPSKSWEALDEIRSQAEEILKQLELPYRVLALCTGDMGFSSAKTFDLEVWLPSQNTFREISSCSNFLDFQARRMRTRFKEGKDKPKFVHTLNGSGLAVGRTLVAILENYQQADGSIKIPKVLIPYMGGLTSLPLD